MKDFSQYNSAEEFIQDMVLEGLIPRNRKIHKAYPSVKPAFSAYYVDKLKKRILERITEAGGIHEDGSLKDGRRLSLTRICRARPRRQLSSGVQSSSRAAGRRAQDQRREAVVPEKQTVHLLSPV